MIQKAFTQTEKGIEVRLVGDVAKAQFEAMASGCNGGACSCECDSNMKAQVTGVSISGEDGDITLSIEGSGLEPEQVAEAMRHCDMEAR